MLRETIVVFAALLVLASATKVNKCGSGEFYEDTNQIQISGCDDPPCKLKRRTQISIEQKFVPDRDINDVKNKVNGILIGVPLPFVGVDGTSACENIFNTDGTKAGCSLKQGTEYLYKNTFPVLPIYPTISLVVYYSLVDEANKIITCFTVPSKIIN